MYGRVYINWDVFCLPLSPKRSVSNETAAKDSGTLEKARKATEQISRMNDRRVCVLFPSFCVIETACFGRCDTFLPSVWIGTVAAETKAEVIENEEWRESWRL